MNAAPEQIVCTSGATEANNLALLGAARFHRKRGAAHRDVAHRASRRARRLPPARARRMRGHLPEAGRRRHRRARAGGGGAARRHAAGVADAREQRDRRRAGHRRDRAACRARGVLFHVDAAQSAGKLPIDVERDCDRPARAHRAQAARTERRRRAVRAARAAPRAGAAAVRRRPGARAALRHAADPPDRRHGRAPTASPRERWRGRPRESRRCASGSGARSRRCRASSSTATRCGAWPAS